MSSLRLILLPCSVGNSVGTSVGDVDKLVVAVPEYVFGYADPVYEYVSLPLLVAVLVHVKLS